MVDSDYLKNLPISERSPVVGDRVLFQLPSGQREIRMVVATYIDSGRNCIYISDSPPNAYRAPNSSRMFAEPRNFQLLPNWSELLELYVKQFQKR